MGKTPRHQVIELAQEIEKHYPVVLLKKPAKTLVMLKMRESVQKSEFFLGEMLACEAMVKINEHRGMALTAGDDFEKVLAMAVVDAAYNANLPETGLLDKKLALMKQVVDRVEQLEFAANMKSKVQFNVMEGQ